MQKNCYENAQKYTTLLSFFLKKHGMGSKLFNWDTSYKVHMIGKTDYGQFTERFMLLFLHIFTFHVLHIICKYTQNLPVCCLCMATKLVLLYNIFA